MKLKLFIISRIDYKPLKSQVFVLNYRSCQYDKEKRTNSSGYRVWV